MIRVGRWSSCGACLVAGRFADAPQIADLATTSAATDSGGTIGTSSGSISTTSTTNTDGCGTTTIADTDGARAWIIPIEIEADQGVIPLDDVPVLVELGPWFPYDDAAPDGSDLRFLASDDPIAAVPLAA